MSNDSRVVRTPHQLGALMRAFRKQAGYSQAALAERLGVSRQAITALEREPEAATFERLMKVWAVLGLEVSLQRATPTAQPPEMEW
ncbi:helix-turn-helix domain-containing protein [Stenotrophomonas rhizophila]|jgi:HTH-type transcriptional regulator/antitoxin HipB|uniref:helix-turn-helix domain-containing protein n=1 Tax=Stenotrophomonas rhizophila TaxID=216778 RepID=UPI0010C10812|nr:helix-turn-helix domain-containing protein [Stenotrophomonas rhizophila]MDY0954946.1 helix-turn-helix domain-containing protein [Stenotrophomonas rhizophila]TKK04653.1 XRE family transcriptional regulator [Stenotrophomonas rhizophila]